VKSNPLATARGEAVAVAVAAPRRRRGGAAAPSAPPPPLPSTTLLLLRRALALLVLLLLLLPLPALALSTPLPAAGMGRPKGSPIIMPDRVRGSAPSPPWRLPLAAARGSKPSSDEDGEEEEEEEEEEEAEGGGGGDEDEGGPPAEPEAAGSGCVEVCNSSSVAAGEECGPPCVWMRDCATAGRDRIPSRSAWPDRGAALVALLTPGDPCPNAVPLRPPAPMLPDDEPSGASPAAAENERSHGRRRRWDT